MSLNQIIYEKYRSLVHDLSKIKFRRLCHIFLYHKYSVKETIFMTIDIFIFHIIRLLTNPVCNSPITHSYFPKHNSFYNTKY